jgi:hypothetical protein
MPISNIRRNPRKPINDPGGYREIHDNKPEEEFGRLRALPVLRAALSGSILGDAH